LERWIGWRAPGRHEITHQKDARYRRRDVGRLLDQLSFLLIDNGVIGGLVSILPAHHPSPVSEKLIFTNRASNITENQLTVDIHRLGMDALAADFRRPFGLRYG
jgi:hypothetical protein